MLFEPQSRLGHHFRSFDTDVDRSGVITKSGKILNRNNLIAVLSRILLTESPNAVIVTNSQLDHLKAFIEALAVSTSSLSFRLSQCNKQSYCFKRTRNRLPISHRNQWSRGISRKLFLDDGAYVIAKILSLLPTLQETGQTLDDLIADLKQPAEVLEVRLPLQTAEPRLLGEQIIEDFFAYLTPSLVGKLIRENEEGIRISLKSSDGSGWFYCG